MCDLDQNQVQTTGPVTCDLPNQLKCSKMNGHTSQLPVKGSWISNSNMMEVGGRIASGIAREVLVR